MWVRPPAPPPPPHPRDYVRFDRPQRLSAAVVGAGFFGARVAQSVAPVVGYALLNGGAGWGSDSTPPSVLRALLVVTGSVLLAQWLVWRRYSLHGPALRRLKRSTEARERRDREGKRWEGDELAL